MTTQMENQGGDNGVAGNNWDLSAVLRFSNLGSMPTTTRTNNPVTQFQAPPLPPPQATYYPIAAFMEGLHQQAISVLPEPQALQDLPHPHAAGWGPHVGQQLWPVYPTAIGNPVPMGPLLGQVPLMAPWPRNEAPVPSIQPRANNSPVSHELKTAPSTSSDGAGPSGPSKRRGTKRDMDRKMILVLADDPTPPDSWQWHKYGQKNIKDTPYNRSYYRCSTIKNCKARKHVQRCLAKTSFLTVTYVSEHSHPMPVARNSQAGSTRQKTMKTTTTRQTQLPRPFSNIPSTANHPRPAPPMSHLLPPFPKFSAAQEQQQTPALPASVSPSLLPVPQPLRIQAEQQPPQAPPTVALAPSRSLLMSPTMLLRSPYAAIQSHPISPFCTCRTCITHQKTPVPLPSSPVINIPSREENQPQAPARMPLPYSWTPNNPLPLSPITQVPTMKERQHTPALPVSAISALLSTNINRQLQPVSPLHRFQAVEQPTEIPAPVLAPPSTSSLLPPTMPLHSASSLEVDMEDDDIDTDTIRMLLKDMEMMTPEEEEEEDPMFFLNLDDEPEHSDVLLSLTPEELPPFYTSAEQNKVYLMTYVPTPGAGSSGSKKNSQVFPVLEEATALGSRSSSDVRTRMGVGAGTAPVQAPTTNVERPLDSDSVSVFWEW